MPRKAKTIKRNALSPQSVITLSVFEKQWNGSRVVCMQPRTVAAFSNKEDAVKNAEEVFVKTTSVGWCLEEARENPGLVHEIEDWCEHCTADFVGTLLKIVDTKGNSGELIIEEVAFNLSTEDIQGRDPWSTLSSSSSLRRVPRPALYTTVARKTARPLPSKAMLNEDSGQESIERDELVTTQQLKKAAIEKSPDNSIRRSIKVKRRNKEFKGLKGISLPAHRPIAKRARKT